MGFINKLFGKKEDLDLDHDLSGLGRPLGEAFPQDNLGLDENPALPEEAEETRFSSRLPPSFSKPANPSSSNPQSGSFQRDLGMRDLELINSKLDTIKAILNSMDQRIANLEKAAGVEQQKKMPW